MGYLQGYYDDQGECLEAIRKERQRQERLKSQGKFSSTCADLDLSHSERLAILGEEYGEACHEVNEGIGAGRSVNQAKLWDELVETAAVCIAWLEAIQKMNQRRAPEGAKRK